MEVKTSNNTQNQVTKMNILTFGNSNVGKTSLITRYTSGCSQQSVRNFGLDFQIKTVMIDQQSIKVLCWDTPRQDRENSNLPWFLRRMQGILICYDVSNQGSFEKAKDWAEKVGIFTNAKSEKVLVACKCDIVEERGVSYEEGLELALELGYKYYETSAKIGYNVDQVYDDLVAIIIEKNTKMKEYSIFC